MKRMIYILTLLSLFFCSSEKNEFMADDLQCEYLGNPLGLDAAKPRFFWKMEKQGRGAHQTAFQIQVASSENLFFIQSNDGSKLFIDNQLVIDHDGHHNTDIETTGKIFLTKGMHSVKLDYFQAGGGLFLSVKYSGHGIAKQFFPALCYI